MLILKYLLVKLASIHPLLSIALILFVILGPIRKESKILWLFSIVAFTDDRGIMNANGDAILINGIYHSKLILYMLISFFSLVLFHYRKRLVLNRSILTFLMIQLLVTFLGFIGLFQYGNSYYAGLQHDMSYTILPLIVLFGLLTWGREDFSITFMDKLLVLIGLEVIFYFVLYLMGVGYDRGGLLLVSLDTGKKLFPVYFILLLSRSMTFDGSFNRRVGFLVIALMALMVNLSFASRSSLIAIMLFVAIELFVHRKAFASIGRFILLSGFVIIIFTIYSDQLSFVLWKLSSFSFTDSSSSLSGAIRYISFLNILEESSFSQFFFGKGFGAYFTDSVIPFGFDLNDKSAFPTEEIVSRRFHKPHTLPLFMFLKVGLVGAVAYSFSFVKQYFHYVKSSTGVAKTFLLMAFIFAINVYSSKLQILAGFFIYIIVKLNVGIRKGSI